MGIRRLRFALILSLSMALGTTSLAFALLPPQSDAQVVPDLDGDEDMLYGGSSHPDDAPRSEQPDQPTETGHPLKVRLAPGELLSIWLHSWMKHLLW